MGLQSNSATAAAALAAVVVGVVLVEVDIGGVRVGALDVLAWVKGPTLTTEPSGCVRLLVPQCTPTS